jgi:hypothetical protein
MTEKNKRYRSKTTFEKEIVPNYYFEDVHEDWEETDEFDQEKTKKFFNMIENTFED